MEIEFDPDKNEENKAKHELDFHDIPYLDWDTALLKIDDRFDYNEERVNAFIRDFSGQAYVVTYTRRDNHIRVISFRRAHERERRKFDV